MNSRTVLFYFTYGILLSRHLMSAYENLALKKPAWQQNPFTSAQWGADRAVDGRYSDRSADGGQCTISDNDKTNATWWVDLGSILSIHLINIYYRTDNIEWDNSNGSKDRLLGFSVYVSNTTDKNEGLLCFKDTNYTRATVPKTLTIDCVMHGRYVIYYNERLPGVTYPTGYSQYAFNELCELEVYGCPTAGFYGKNCDLPCPQNCQERHCNIEDGTCLGCVPGFKDLKCDEECDGRMYEQSCNQSCGYCLNAEQCDHINGSCLERCDKGYQGDRCIKECPIGRYGYNCNDTCSINCGVPGRCNRATGNCEGGCQAGWEGRRCDKKCDDGKFGLDCNQSCGICFGNEACHHINGTCLNGCDRGYLGINCAQACPDGRYGYNCKDMCSINCTDPKNCDRVSGQCSACYPGWYGRDCEIECGNCNGNDTCHHVTGACPSLCEPGYQQQKCNEPCFHGWYGRECKERCGYCRGNKPCNHVTGSCSGLCEPGYHGEQCVDSVFSQHLGNQRIMIKLLRKFLAFKIRIGELRENGNSPTDFN